MSEPRDKHADRQIEFLRELLQENASIDGDVLEVTQSNWVIHGLFPYEGQVEMAVFETREEATYVLDEVCGFQSPEEP